MKNIISVLLSALIVLMFAACADRQPASPSSETAGVTSDASSSEPTDSSADQTTSSDKETSSSPSQNTASSKPSSSRDGSVSSAPTVTPEKEKVCSHSYTTTAFAPTALSGGYDEHICKNCGYTFRDNFTDPLEPEAFSEGLEFKSNSDGTCALVGIGTCTDTTVNIPSKSPAGDTVTTVKGPVFSENKNITEVRFPDTVTAFSGNVFYKCSNLKSVVMPKTSFSLPNMFFNSCGKLEKVDFTGSKLTSIGENCFSSCSSLVSVALPSTLSQIGKLAFNSCTKLVSVTYGDTPLTVGIRAFDYCPALKECRSVNSTSSLDTVVSIGEAAFRNTKLSKIAFSDDLKRIGASAFENCRNLGAIDLSGTNITYIPISCFENTTVSSVIMPESLNTVCGSAFAECFNLKTIVIPDNVSRIDASAFSNCAFEKLYIGSGVQQIGEKCFYGCAGEVIWSEYSTITSMGKAYYGYQGTSVSLPDSLNEIYRGALEGCTKLIYLKTPLYFATVGDNTSHCLGSLFKDNIDPWNQDTVIPSTLKTVVLTRDTYIETRAFMNVDLTNLVLGRNISEIASLAFDLGSVANVFYEGDAAMWNSVSNNSSDISSAALYYYSEQEPSSSGNYWHYSTKGLPVKW